MEINTTFAVLTFSDKGAKGEREDTSGAYLKEKLVESGYRLGGYAIIADEYDEIREGLLRYADDEGVGLLVTTGGTGLSPRDVTPEATRAVLDREIPGIAEAMRAASMEKTDRAMLSRGIAGIRRQCLIVNLPGSLKAVRENLEVILPVLGHALEKIQGGGGDCGQQ